MAHAPAGREGPSSSNASGQDFAGPQVALAAEIEALQLARDAFQGGDSFQDFHAFGRHFRPRAVAADHRHLQHTATHGRTCSRVENDMGSVAF